MWRDVNGHDAVGVDMLVGIGGDVHDVMIRKNVWHSRSRFTNAGGASRQITLVCSVRPDDIEAIGSGMLLSRAPIGPE